MCWYFSVPHSLKCQANLLLLILFPGVQLTAVAESRLEKDDNQGSNTAVLRLAQGDEVWTVHKSGGTETYGAQADRETSFMGVLLYETEV